MATQSLISLDTGSTINVGTYIVSEGSNTIHLNRSVLSDSSGVDFGIVTNPVYVIPSGGATTVTNTVTITGSTTIVGTPSVTGSVTVVGTLPAVTGSVTLVGTSTITGAVTVIGGTFGTITITGSTSVVNTVTITGSTSVVNTVTVTGSTSVVNSVTVTGSVSIVTAPSFGSATINVSTAGTSIIIPSTATNSIYLTSLFVMNGNTAGTIYLGYATSATAPTTTAILIQPLYFAANCGAVYPIPEITPIKLAATTNLVCTVASSGSLSVVATYYVAP